MSEGQDSIENDPERQRRVISQVVESLTELGEGSDKGIPVHDGGSFRTSELLCYVRNRRIL